MSTNNSLNDIKNVSIPEAMVKDAIKNGMSGLKVSYMPIVDMSAATWRGVEVGCILDTPEFCDVVMSHHTLSGFSKDTVCAIVTWMIEEAIKQVKLLKLDEIHRFMLIVSVPDIGGPCMKRLPEMIVKLDYPPERLCIVSPEMNEYSDAVLDVMQELSGCGIALCIGDFESGYAAFKSLLKLPIKAIRPSTAFLSGLETDQFTKQYLSAMLDLAQQEGINVLAQGVETAEQVRFFLRQDIDYFQGGLFSKWLNAEQLVERVEYFHESTTGLFPDEWLNSDDSKILVEKQNYKLNPTQNRVIIGCLEELLFNHDVDLSISSVLRWVGEYLRVSRTYLIMRENDNSFSIKYEWCLKGAASVSASFRHTTIRNDTIHTESIKRLLQDGVLLASDTFTIEPAAAEFFSRYGIRALMQFPILQGDRIQAIVAVDDCVGARHWTQEEVHMVEVLTKMISSVLGRKWMASEIEARGEMLSHVLNNLDSAIFVSDLETGEILFVNSGVKKIYGERPLLGRQCFQVFHNKPWRCDNCPVNTLMDNQEDSSSREVYNDVLNRHFRVRNAIIPWIEDRRVHLECFEDITELKEIQNRLALCASIDMPTSTLNRFSFLNFAKDSLIRARAEEVPMTFAFIDIDGLKEKNDREGHAAGDKLIADVVKVLRKHTRGSDIVGRYGGDEFVVAFYKCTTEFAEKRVLDSLKALKEISREEGVPDVSFSFGLAETNEVSEHEALDDCLTKLLVMADRRMLKQKSEKK